MQIDHVALSNRFGVRCWMAAVPANQAVRKKTVKEVSQLSSKGHSQKDPFSCLSIICGLPSRTIICLSNHRLGK
jgi:hypothetical protein